MNRGRFSYLILFLCHIIFGYWVWVSFSWPILLSGVLIFYTFGKLGGDIGLHRYYCHRSFETGKVWQYLMLYCGVIFGSGSSVAWSAFHHYHHSQVDGKPPGERSHDTGWTRIYFSLFNRDIKLDKSNLRFVQRALKDPKQAFAHKYYFHIMFGYILITLLIGAAVGNIWIVMALWVIPKLIAYHMAALVDIIGHKWGYQTYSIGGDSKNNIWWNVLCLGTAMHNIHHSYPRRCYQGGDKWYEFDTCGWFIKRFMEKK